MPYYIKVTKKVKESIVPSYVGVSKTADGNYLLYQSALSDIEGNTLTERAEKVGGAILNVLQAREEINGTKTPASCHTPKEYGGDDDISDNANMPSGIDSSVKPSQEVSTPKVDATAEESGNKSNNEKEESEVIDE